MVLTKQCKTSTLFYLVSDTGTQEAVCPASINLSDEFRKMREQNIAEGVLTEANETMKANFAKNSIPYSDMNAEDWHDKPVW